MLSVITTDGLEIEALASEVALARSFRQMCGRALSFDLRPMLLARSGAVRVVLFCGDNSGTVHRDQRAVVLEVMDNRCSEQRLSSQRGRVDKRSFSV